MKTILSVFFIDLKPITILNFYSSLAILFYSLASHGREDKFLLLFISLFIHFFFNSKSILSAYNKLSNEVYRFVMKEKCKKHQ